MKKPKIHHKIGRLFWLIFLGGFIIKLVSFLFHKKGDISSYKKNFSEFLHKEKEEIDQVSHGEETLSEYFKDSESIFKDFFIPHKGNGHKPKILHSKSLVVIVLLLGILKLWSFGFLLFSYPDEALLSEDIVNAVLVLTNEDRAAEDLGKLTLDPALSASAFAKANDMVIQGYFDHYGPDGKKPWDWIDRENYRYIFVGENLAMNFTSARSAHTALMNSPSHKKNIMNSRYTDIGLAMVSGEINGKNTNVLVELFGAKEAPKLALATENDDKSIAGTTAAAPVVKTAALEAPKINTEPKINFEEALKEESIKAAPIIEAVPQNKETEETEEEEVEAIITREQIAVSPQAASSSATLGKIVKIDEEIAPIGEFEEITAGISASIEVMENTADQKITVAMKVSEYLKYFFALVLVLFIIILSVNIFMHIRVQHGHVIIQSLLVIIFISGLIFIKLHFLENGLPSILIL